MASRGTSDSPRKSYAGNSRGGRGRGGIYDQKSPTYSATGRGRGAASGPSSPGRGGFVSRPDGARKGVCDWYWRTGACTRGFNCIYSHEAKPDLNVLTQPSDSTLTTASEDLDFFSIQGLTTNNGSIRSEDQNMKPAEAHNHLKTLLQKGEVTTASKALGMVRVFGSVNSRNKHWDLERAQQFLDTVVHGDALLRVGEILRFTPVSADAGPGSGSLSFQRGYFPLLEFFATDLVLKTTVHQNTNMLYTLLEINYDALHATLSTCMDQLITARSWVDSKTTGHRTCTIDGVLVFKVLSVILSQFLQRFKSAIRNHPSLLDLVQALSGWFDEWSQGIRSKAFQDPILESQAGIRDFTIEQLGREIHKLRSIVRRESGIADEQRKPKRRAGISDAQRQEILVSQLSQAYDPPGDLRDEGPRHDNDFSSIADIRIAPTQEELMCGVDSYLPAVVAGAPHHLLAAQISNRNTF